jgi:hypothetical protein
MNALSPVALPLAQGLLVALAVGLGLALLVGALLLARPRALFALNAWLSRWVDTRRAFGMLDEPHHLERFFYRHHRILGALIVAGAGYVLWRWAFYYQRADLVALLGARWLSRGLDWLPGALETALVTLHGAILMIGVLVFFRPSLLKGFERTANHWQPGLATTPLDTVVGNLDGAFEGHPRVSGLLLVVSAFWCLLALAPVIVDVLAR